MFMWLTYGLYCAVIFTTVDYSNAKTLWEEIQTHGEVRWVARSIVTFGLIDLYHQDNVTVFLPTNYAYFSFNATKYGYDKNNSTVWRNIYLYSSVSGALFQEAMTENERVPTRLGESQHLFFNVFSEGNTQFPTVNGARIVKGDVRTENGVLHIIDRVMAPVASTKSLPEYLKTPDIPHYSFKSIIKAKIVVPEVERETANRSLFFTSLVPADSFLTSMPDHGQDILFADRTLLANVYKAHLVPYSVHFLPKAGSMPDIIATEGTLTFSKYNGQMYVSNNRVRARIVLSNIPVANGVIHVIDNLLYFVYDNILQRISSMKDTSEMSRLLSKMPPNLIERLKKTDEIFTVFVPTDWAFGKIPSSQKQELNREDEEGKKVLKYLIFGHIVSGVIIDSKNLSGDQVLTSLDNRTISVIHLDGETYIESGSVRAKIEVMDIGCTNGIIHLISNVLFLKNFTLWEAIENIRELSIMHSFAINYSDVEDPLSTDTSGPLTVFIASNSVLDSAPTALKTLQKYPHLVHQALRGQIVQGLFSSSAVTNSVQVGTMAGKSLRIYKDQGSEGVLMVEGSHVKARVIVKDIWCSNGILHIVDDILHVPIRSIISEMKRRHYLSFTQGMFRALSEIQTKLQNLTERFTVFIPHNDAYSRLPWDDIEGLMRDIPRARKLMNAHIVTGQAKFIEELSNRQMLTADENVIYVLKRGRKVYVVNNNLWSEVIISDIPAANGRIHVIDTLLYFPYSTIAERLRNTMELRPFYSMMSQEPEFARMISASGRNLTLFVPSSAYLSSIPRNRLEYMKRTPYVLKRLFKGHVLPQVRLDDVFLRRYPDENYSSRSSLNTTIRLSRRNGETFIDAGFQPQYIDLIEQGFGCIDGVIYAVDGFLNYSPYKMMDRLRSIKHIQKSLDQMIRLSSANATDLLSRDDMTFTFLAPNDKSLRKLEFTDFATLRNFPLSEKLKVFWRHAINGTLVTFQELKQKSVRPELLPDGVSLETTSEAVYFKWRHVRARVLESNFLASNGVIHILDSFLFSTSEPRPPKRTTTTTSSPPIQGTTSLRGSQSVIVFLVILSSVISFLFT